MPSLLRPACACLLTAALGVVPVSAQEIQPEKAPSHDAAPTASPGTTSWLTPDAVDFSPRPKWSPMATLGRDFRTLFKSTSTWTILGATAAVAATTARWDGQTAVESREHLPASRFRLGNIGGSLLVQGGGAVGAWALGTALHSPRLAAVGGDLIEAQVLTQTVVQTLKFSVQRPRPDGSDRLSFPSGHTASSFATASVLERHFGWKAGVPAYAFASYVGAARMAADKHHLSDVLVGAGIGIVAGRSVTIGVGDHRFDMGVAPTTGGAMVTFNRR